MRLRRLCEQKPGTGRCNVDPQTHEQWKQGGTGREELERALITALRTVPNVMDTKQVQDRDLLTNTPQLFFFASLFAGRVQGPGDIRPGAVEDNRPGPQRRVVHGGTNADGAKALGVP